jgi:hypothetical protein
LVTFWACVEICIRVSLNIQNWNDTMQSHDKTSYNIFFIKSLRKLHHSSKQLFMEISRTAVISERGINWNLHCSCGDLYVNISIACQRRERGTRTVTCTSSRHRFLWRKKLPTTACSRLLYGDTWITVVEVFEDGRVKLHLIRRLTENRQANECQPSAACWLSRCHRLQISFSVIYGRRKNAASACHVIVKSFDGATISRMTTFTFYGSIF